MRARAMHREREVDAVDETASTTTATTTCVSQSDTRIGRPAFDAMEGRLMAHNRATCEGDGPSCSYRLERPPESASPYWAKVFLVRDLLRSGSCDRVIWLDSDATLHLGRSVCESVDDDGVRRCDGATRAGVSAVADELFNGAEFFYAGHTAVTCPVGLNWVAKFNAGVWGVNNSTKGREIMDTWAQLYPRQNWRMNPDNTSWTCNDESRDGTCAYSGGKYEQGAFIRYVMPKYANAGVLREHDACHIGSPCASKAEATSRGASVCHFLGCFKDHYAASYLVGNFTSANLDEIPGELAHCPHANARFSLQSASGVVSIDGNRVARVVGCGVLLTLIVALFGLLKRRSAETRKVQSCGDKDESTPLV